MFRFLLVLILVVPLSVKASNNFEFSGFGRVVAGSFSQADSQLRGYTDEISLGEDSLLGLRSSYSFNDDFKLVAQLIAHSSDTRDSGIQWLYLDYQITPAFSLKLGRQRLPLYTYSDFIDVGFAYPWITPPIANYSNEIFTEFDGLTGRYDFSNQYLRGYIEAYFGNYEDSIGMPGDEVQVDVDRIHGIVGSINYSKWSFRASYHSGDTEVLQDDTVQFMQTLRALGFTESAQSLTFDDPANLFQVGFAFEDINYFFRGEHTVVTSDAFIADKRRASYVTAGYNIHPFTLHATLAYGKSSYPEPPNEIPFGIDPAIDQIAFAYSAFLDSLPRDQGQQYTLGIRYDYNSNIAFKAEATHINGAPNSRGFLDVANGEENQQQGTLVQFAIEWVY